MQSMVSTLHMMTSSMLRSVTIAPWWGMSQRTAQTEARKQSERWFVQLERLLEIMMSLFENLLISCYLSFRTSTSSFVERDPHYSERYDTVVQRSEYLICVLLISTWKNDAKRDVYTIREFLIYSWFLPESQVPAAPVVPTWWMWLAFM